MNQQSTAEPTEHIYIYIYIYIATVSAGAQVFSQRC